MATYATPGVIIEEITGPGVIAGVGTSTAGFIGPALAGPVYTPVRISNWDEFERLYGRPGATGTEIYIAEPLSYLAHAVRGFFDNGGSQAWIVRVGTAARSARDLPPRSGTGSSLHVEALVEGAAGDQISVRTAASALADAVALAIPTATIVNATGRTVTVDDASDFRPGDIVTRDTTNERQPIERIDYPSSTIHLAGDLLADYTDGTLRIADLKKGQAAFRLADPDVKLYPGSVARLARGGTTTPVFSVAAQRDGIVTVEGGLPGGLTITNTPITLSSYEFDLTVLLTGSADEPFAGLSMSPRHPGYYERAVTSSRVRLLPPGTPPSALPPDDRPANGTLALQGGADDDLRSIGAQEYSRGIEAFDDVDDVNLMCIPDIEDTGTQAELLDHCTLKADRFALLHVARGRDQAGALTHRADVGDEKGFAALYWPWIQVRDPLSRTGELMLMPPVGHIAGVYARVDSERGVHKAPANETVRGALGLERAVTDAQQAPLNVAGVNVARTFPGLARPVLWGARTTVRTDITDWTYVNVRRLLLYLEESLQEGLRWAVFEPNDLALWQKLKRTITAFLTGVWRDGALFGATAEEAFMVRIDEGLNPPASRALGRLFIEIKVAPVRPAEFIVVRIGLWDGGGEVSEG
jgi:phage tail sheath protein FI